MAVVWPSHAAPDGHLSHLISASGLSGHRELWSCRLQIIWAATMRAQVKEGCRPELGGYTRQPFRD